MWSHAMGCCVQEPGIHVLRLEGELHFGNAMVVRETIVAAGSSPGTAPTVPTPLLRPFEAAALQAVAATGAEAAGGDLLSAVSDAARAAAEEEEEVGLPGDAAAGSRSFISGRTGAGSLACVLRGSDDRDALAAVVHSPALRAVAQQQRGVRHAAGGTGKGAPSPARRIKGECRTAPRAWLATLHFQSDILFGFDSCTRKCI